ncbi:MAG: hypothetical protein ACK517_01355, partial [bacterium]
MLSSIFEFRPIQARDVWQNAYWDITTRRPAGGNPSLKRLVYKDCFYILENRFQIDSYQQPITRTQPGIIG